MIVSFCGRTSTFFWDMIPRLSHFHKFIGYPLHVDTCHRKVGPYGPGAAKGSRCEASAAVRTFVDYM
jgi:hypothetical protein